MRIVQRNSTFTQLRTPEDNNASLNTILINNFSMTDHNSTALILLTDELKPCLLFRMAKRLALISDNILDYLESRLTENTATSIASLSILIIVISIVCCFIAGLMREEEKRLKEQYKKLGERINTSLGIAGNRSGLTRVSENRLIVHELRRETYFGLIRLSKPGCRTIVLLCDTQSRLKLLPKFYACVYPYRRNKTLSFAFLLIEKNIEWYKELLRLALNEKRELHINPKNCTGTILALSGFKKYFCVYHASDSRFDPEEPEVLLEESLLDDLSCWLEKLFAGKPSRYHVKYWPDHMK